MIILVLTLIYVFPFVTSAECDIQFSESCSIGDKVTVSCHCEDPCGHVFLTKNGSDVAVTGEDFHYSPDGCQLNYTYEASAADNGTNFTCAELIGGSIFNSKSALFHVPENSMFDGQCNSSVSYLDSTIVNITLSCKVNNLKDDCSGQTVKVYFQNGLNYTFEIENILQDNSNIIVVSIDVPTTVECVVNVSLVDSSGSVIDFVRVDCKHALTTSLMSSVGPSPTISPSPIESSEPNTVVLTTSRNGISGLSGGGVAIIGAAIAVTIGLDIVVAISVIAVIACICKHRRGKHILNSRPERGTTQDN